MKTADAPVSRVIECGLCGVTFEEDRGQPTCQACPLSRACRFVRCPDCGYENPITPGWLDRLKKLVGQEAGTDGQRPPGAGEA